MKNLFDWDSRMIKSSMPVLLTLILVVSIVGNIFLLYENTQVKRNPKTGDSSVLKETLQEYPFLSYRIFRENPNDIFVNFMPLRESLREYVRNQNNAVSVYFEYLPSGSSVRINDETEVRLASLIKLPTIMAVYDKINRGEITRDQVLTLREEHIDPVYGDFWKKGVGAEITVEEAIRLSLVDSDNTSSRMLYDLLTPEEELRLFLQLDTRAEMENGKTVPYMTTKSYSSILKSLYFANYLPNELSNEVLSILSESSFDSGIEAGVDSSIKVAHKMGILHSDTTTNVYNDCGIIYFPKRPYLLCIFVQGEDDALAFTSMQYISRMVYGYIHEVNASR